MTWSNAWAERLCRMFGHKPAWLTLPDLWKNPWADVLYYGCTRCRKQLDHDSSRSDQDN